MAFLDKLTDAVATVADKTSDAVETTKIKTRINGEKKDIDAEFIKLGKILYEKIKDGEEGSEMIDACIKAIDQHKEIIAELEKQLADI